VAWYARIVQSRAIQPHFSALVTASFLAGTAHSVPVQWEIAAGGNDHFYEVVLADALTWDQANAAAALRPLAGAWHLATITSAAENAFIESLLNSSSLFPNCFSGTAAGTICTGLWIGATSTSIGSNDWTWVTGEAFSFTDWGPFEPATNGDRISFDAFVTSGQFAWNDAPNLWPYDSGYIVEAPEPSTALLIACVLAGITARRRRAHERVPINARR